MSNFERRQADLFYADLVGRSRRSSYPPISGEDVNELRKGRIVFYDEETLRLIEGWTRATAADRVYVVNRSQFDAVRADGRRRSAQFDDFIRRTLAGRKDLQPPLFVMHDGLHTAPLSSNGAAGWDDLMIDGLAKVGRLVTVQSEQDQWVVINRLFAAAKQAAQKSGQIQKPAQEFVAYFVLDVIKATLTIVPAANVRMNGHHAVVPIGHINGSNRLALPGGDAAQRVIGDIHTHYLLDPLINTTSTTLGTTYRSSVTTMGNGVSDVDVESAKTEKMVVYAVDSKWLHRANPDGSKNDKLDRKGNVLREALRIFGGEPRM